jgi:radical SAM enzyme (TIGR01210 family)
MPRENKSPHRRSPNQPAAIWREKDSLDGKLVDAGVVILRTSGCSHYHKGGCSMCGYNYESDRNVTQKDIIDQFDNAMTDLGEIHFIKVYTSGSFLDVCEISKEAARHVLRQTADRGMRLLFESRPEFVTPATVAEALSVNENLEIALGLESSNDRVLRYSINKGFSRADYETAAKTIADAGIDLRTYVLLKPPFLTEAEAIADSKETIELASRFSKTISLNPVNVQKGTLVEKLWRNWAYRPPWLWSVLDVLRNSQRDGRRLVCEPTGGGKERGAHNCGKCDETILASLKAFSESQDIGRLGSPDCECREIWDAVKELDGFVMGGTVDLQRFSRQPKKRQ